MKNVTFQDIGAVVENLMEIQRTLEECPSVLEYLRLTTKAGAGAMQAPVMVVQQDRLVMIGEACKILGISTKTLLDLEKAGALPAYYVGEKSHKKYKLSDLWKLPHKAEQLPIYKLNKNTPKKTGGAVPPVNLG